MPDYYSYAPLVRLDRALIVLALPGTELTAIVKMLGSFSGVVPKGYLSTGAYWYQDFPLMSQTSQAPWDFTHLANDPVAGFSDCGQW